MIKDKADNLQDKLYQHMEVQEMIVGASSSSPLVDDTEGGGLLDLPSATITDSILLVNRTHDDVCGT